MKDLKIITVDDLHSTIRTFIIDNDVIIGDYDDMKSLILKMIRNGHMFNMDRDRLRDAMEDITFMLCPDDDANKDRVERGLEYDDDSGGDDEEEDLLEEDFLKEDLQDHSNKSIQTGNKSPPIEDIGNTEDLQ